MDGPNSINNSSKSSLHKLIWLLIALQSLGPVEGNRVRSATTEGNNAWITGQAVPRKTYRQTIKQTKTQQNKQKHHSFLACIKNREGTGEHHINTLLFTQRHTALPGGAECCFHAKHWQINQQY